MERHPQWEQRLHEFVSANIDRPHVWGRHDCLLFSAGVAKAITGKDHAKGHRGKYKSFASAYAYLRTEFGVDSPEALLDKMFDEKRVGFAGRGDIVLCRVDAVAGAGGEPVPGEVPGLCLGSFALIAGENKLERVPRGDRWLKAWAVGEHHSGDVAHV
jgi:hypothetical protein